MGVFLCQRDDVMSALDVKSTARDEAQIDRLIESASRGVERYLHRRFAPTLATRYFDWPNDQMGRSWRLWLDENELISLTSLTAGGAAISPANLLLEPANYGPPYNRIEINLGTTSAFSTGSTYQRDIAVTGVFGYSDDEVNVGTTVGTFNSTDDLVTIADGVLAGVGSVLLCESERLLLLDRIMVDTGRKTGGANLASYADNTVITDGATIYAGEVVLIDAEQMLVTDIVGNNLVVKRGWSGSTLATHSSTTSIYSPRQFKVQRGALGTTAATHANGTIWSAWQVPGPVRQLTIAEVLNSFQQEQSAYARTIGSGDRQQSSSSYGIEDIRQQVYMTHGRKARQRVV